MKILYILLFSCYIIHSKEVLRHVHILFRHGDRAPSTLFSDDINKFKLWSFGFGQLTDIGIKQHFALGKWLRLRYKSFIKHKYSSEEIFIKSTDVDRTLMSAQANLAGMYYNLRNEIIPQLKWRPIPVHTVPLISTTLILPKECNPYREKVQEMYKTSWYQSLYSEYQSALDVMRNISKINDLTFQDSWYIFDSLFCERSHNITLDPWVTKALYENISKIYNIGWKMMYYGDELGRLSGGQTLNNIISELKDYAENAENRTDKMHVLSGHDTDIAALLSAIGINDGNRPPYAACLMIDLIHRPINDSDVLKNWIVKIYFKRFETDSPSELPENKLRGCKSQPCSLADFIEYVKPRTIDKETYEKMCESKK